MTTAATSLGGVVLARSIMDIFNIRQRARARARCGLEVVWGEYLAWLGATFPRVAASLQPPDPTAARALAELADTVGAPMPEEMAALYRLTGGEPARVMDDGGHGVLFGVALMPIAEVVSYARRPFKWDADGVARDMQDEDCRPEVREPTRLRAAALHRGWVPFGDAAGGNYIAVDLAPGPAGTVGQVINIGQNEEVRFVLADSIAEFVALLHELGLAGVVEVIEGGESEHTTRSATCFGPTGVSLVDQLRLWFFPDPRG